MKWKFWRGAEALIQEYHPIFFIELDDENLKDQGSNAPELIQFLISHGYKIRHAETNEVLTNESDFNNCHSDIIAEI